MYVPKCCHMLYIEKFEYISQLDFYYELSVHEFNALPMFTFTLWLIWNICHFLHKYQTLLRNRSVYIVIHYLQLGDEEMFETDITILQLNSDWMLTQYIRIPIDRAFHWMHFGLMLFIRNILSISTQYDDKA